MDKKVRLSNLELLRLIAMFGVLAVHTDFGALGTPDKAELTHNTFYCITRTAIEMFAIVAVNVFVLISGWFGINFRWKGLSNLLFQCAFFFFGIYFACVLTGIKDFGLNGLYMCLMMSSNAWFVKAYLGMYILAPVMNAFAANADRKTFARLLLCFFAFQSIYGWFSNGAQYIDKGYSAFSFMGLYLLARYVRIYRPSWSRWSAFRSFAAYAATALSGAVLFLAFLLADLPAMSYIMISYTSPFIIASAIFLLMTFDRFKIQSRTINTVAASCFAVYLFHFILFPTFMNPWIQQIAATHNGVAEFALITSLLLAFFTAAILIDRIRLFLWNRFMMPLFDR